MMIEHDGTAIESRHESRVRVLPNVIAAAEVIRRCRGHISARLDAGRCSCGMVGETIFVRLCWQGREGFHHGDVRAEPGSVVCLPRPDGRPRIAITCGGGCAQCSDRLGCNAKTDGRRYRSCAEMLRGGNRKAGIASVATLASSASNTVSVDVPDQVHRSPLVMRMTARIVDFNEPTRGALRCTTPNPNSERDSIGYALDIVEYGIDLGDETLARSRRVSSHPFLRLGWLGGGVRCSFRDRSCSQVP